MQASFENNWNFFLTASTAFMLNRALYVAADLAIADILAVKPCSIHELTAKTNSNEEALHRLLHLLQLYDVFYCDTNGLYHNTERSEYMRSNHQQSVRPLLLHEDETRWNSIGNLKLSIITGKPAFDDIYEMPYFSYTNMHPVLSDRFNKAMVTISDFEEKAIAEAYPFNNFLTVADLGGGKGGMLTKILKQYDTIHAVLADLPEVVKDHQVPPWYADRFSVQPIDLFQPVAINADLFILKRILHDWDDEKSVHILRIIAATMSPSSKLLIIEALVTDEANEQSQMLAQIDLLLLAVFGGRERTYAAYNDIITKAGFTIMHVYPTNSLVSIIECKRI